MKAPREDQGCDSGTEAPVDLLDAIVVGQEPIELRHGAVDIARHGPVDVVRVRGATGTIEIEMTARGPRLRLQAVDIEIASDGPMSFVGSDISLKSKGRLEIACDGDMVTAVGGGRHTRVEGPERTEARSIEMQSNAGGMGLRARDAIAIDGERIGLNSLDIPEPFPWSSAASEEP